MALSIKPEMVDQLARKLAALTGETITKAVQRALSDRLERALPRGRSVEALQELQIYASSLPILDQRR